jgi:RNA polymerase sigma factor (sigma-70 family)
MSKRGGSRKSNGQTLPSSPPDAPFRPRLAALDDTSVDTLKAYMRDLAHTPRMSPDLEVELGQRLEQARRTIARSISTSADGVAALVSLKCALRREPALAKRLFLPSGPEDDAGAPAERARVITSALDAIAEECARNGATAALEPLVYAVRLTDDGLTALLRRWPATGDEDAARRRLIETARAELQASRRRLVEANLRLVLWEIGKTARRGVDVEDLIQEGNFALLRAAELYEPSRDVRFSSYAIWWIRARIKRALQQRGAAVRLPLHVQRQINDLNTKARRLTVELGREPTLQELAAAVSLSADIVRKTLSRAAATEVVSLHTSANDEVPPLESALADPNGVTALDALVQRELLSWLRETLDDLSDREKTVIMLRFGFDEQERELSLADIAREFGLSRERVRQIETIALRRLCSGTRRAELVARCDSTRAPALKKNIARVEEQLKKLRRRPRRGRPVPPDIASD